MTTYQLTPWTETTTGHDQWVARRYEVSSSATPTFRTKDHGAAFGGIAIRCLCWSQALNTESWYDFDNRVDNGSTIDHSNNAAFAGGDIYLCTWPAYPYERARSKVAEWLAGSYCSDTASGTDGVVGADSVARVNFYQRVVPALNYYGFLLTGPAGNPKNKAILMSGVHAGEPIGGWVLEGAIEFLLSDDAMAVALRAWFEFYIYPMINPQGRYGGYSRTQPEDTTLDPNRQWATPGALECIDTFKAVITADTGGVGEVHAAFDFHLDWSFTAPTGYAVDKTARKHPEFLAAMNAYDATYIQADLAPAGTSIKWFETLDNAGSLRLALTPEDLVLLSDRPTPVSGHKAYGANLMRALYALLANGDFPNGP